MRTKHLFSVLGCAGLALATQVNAATITFDWGTDASLGAPGDQGVTSKTFSKGGASLTIASFGSGGDLWIKNLGGSESGLGQANESAHEISSASGFLQISLPPSPPGSTLDLLVSGSVQSGEHSAVFFSLVNGTLGLVPVIGSAGPGAEQEQFIIPAGLFPYIDITASSGDVLVDTAQVTTPNVRVPDGGMTVALLGGALTALGFARRKMVA